MFEMSNSRWGDIKNASMVACFSKGKSADPGYIYDALYLTEDGMWYLYAIRGARSEYGKQLGMNEVRSNVKVIPIDKEDALQWLERHERHDQISYYFHDCVEYSS